MAYVKWIKFSTGFPNSRKLRQIRSLPDGDTIALLWVFLLCVAGEINDEGMIYLTPEVPYTEEMLAEEFDMEINTIRLGLQTFQRYGMIELVDDIICLSSWEKWQNVDKLSEIREQTRIRVAKHREKQKLLASNVTCNVTVTQGNATDIDKDEDKDLEGEGEVIQETVSYQQVVDMYHSICISYPKVKALPEKRKKAIKARLKTYSIDDIRQAFEMAEESKFLKGSNNRNWSANFDWIMSDSNMAKILEGNYKNETTSEPKDTRESYIDKWRNA